MTTLVPPTDTSSPTTTQRLIINPALQVIRGSDDELIVRNGSRGRSAQRLSDEARRGVLCDFVGAFAGGAEPTSVLAVHPEAADMLDGLVERHVLIDEREAEYSFLVGGLGLRLSDCRVGAVDLVGRGALADATADAIRDALPDAVEVRRHDHVSGAAEIDELELLVVTSDTPDLPLFFDVNELALTLGTPWHAAYMDGAEAVVGPLYLPGTTGCFHDFDVIEEAGRSMRIDLVHAKLTATRDRGRVPRFAAGLAAGYLTSSLLQDIFGVGSHLEGHFLRIDLDRLEVIRQQLSRLARCPACMENRPDLRHPFV